MEIPRECLVMAKPAGPRCNMRCSYCYYVGKTELLGSTGDAASMDGELLERYVAQRISSSPGPVTHFEWHGGEPTLLGIDFFREVVRLQKKHRPANRRITNGLQTNGLLIDAAWADFLAHERFSVGLSLDGPAEMHDRYRRTLDGEPTHARAVAAFALLRSRGVFCNVLCVLSAANVGAPDRVYDFFEARGVTYLQFLPLVSRSAARGDPPDATDVTAPAEAIGEFLCRVFDRWIADDVGRIVVQAFDEALRPLHGVPHALCIHRETCGDVAVLERDGSFYACDHFVDPVHRIGNIRARDLSDLATDPAMEAFGRLKKDTLPDTCKECDVLSFCNGGCIKDRLPTGVSYLCPAYRRFFRHVVPELRRLSLHMKAGRRLRDFRAAASR